MFLFNLNVTINERFYYNKSPRNFVVDSCLTNCPLFGVHSINEAKDYNA